jgi:hypothetical protein
VSGSAGARGYTIPSLCAPPSINLRSANIPPLPEVSLNEFFPLW